MRAGRAALFACLAVVVVLGAADLGERGRVLAPAALADTLSKASSSSRNPEGLAFGELITFAFNFPLMALDLFWTRYVAVRGAAHTARNSLRVMGAETELSELASAVDGEIKAVMDVQGSVFNDVAAANQLFLHAEARAALRAADAVDVCRLAGEVFKASKSWAAEFDAQKPEDAMKAVIDVAQEDIGKGNDDKKVDSDLVKEQLLDEMKLAFDSALAEVHGGDIDEITMQSQPPLYTKKELEDFEKLVESCACKELTNEAAKKEPGADMRSSPTCESLKGALGDMLTRETAAVHKWLGWSSHASALAKNNQLILFRALKALAADKNNAVKAAPDNKDISIANVKGAIIARQGPYTKDPPGTPAEFSIISFTFLQKVARLDWIKSIEKDHWEAFGGSNSPQYLILYNGLMLLELVTNCVRNLMSVFQMKTLAGETARFTIARSVGMAREHADVDTALALLSACSNLVAVHKAAAGLVQEAADGQPKGALSLSFDAKDKRMNKYFAFAGMASSVDPEATVFSVWLKGLGTEITDPLSKRVYEQFQRSTRFLLDRVAAPFAVRGNLDGAPDKGGNGIGRCYQSLQFAGALSGSVKLADSPQNSHQGWLLSAKQSVELEEAGFKTAEQQLKRVFKLPEESMSQDIVQRLSPDEKSLLSEARPAAVYININPDISDDNLDGGGKSIVNSVKSAGNCLGAAAGDIYDIILIADGDEDFVNDLAGGGAAVTPGTFYEKLTRQTANLRRVVREGGEKVRTGTAYDWFAGTEARNAELNAKLGYVRKAKKLFGFGAGSTCANCQPPKDVVISVADDSRGTGFKKAALKAVPRTYAKKQVDAAGKTVRASRKFYVARCESVLKDAAYALWLAADYNKEELKQLRATNGAKPAGLVNPDAALRPVQMLHLLVLEKDGKEPLAWAKEVQKMVAGGMRLVSGLRLQDLKNAGVVKITLQHLRKQRQADYDFLKTVFADMKDTEKGLGVQGSKLRDSFVGLLDRSDLNRGQRGGKGAVKNGAPYVLAFVGRGSVAPIKDLQLVPFMAMGEFASTLWRKERESLKINDLVANENVVRAKYQGWWARKFRDQHDTKNSKAVTKEVIAKTAEEVKKLRARGEAAEYNAFTKLTDAPLPYLQAPAGCTISDEVQLKRATEKVLTASWWWGASKKVRHARGFVTHKFRTDCKEKKATAVPELWDRLIISPKAGAEVYGAKSGSFMDYDAEIMRPHLWARRRILAHERDFLAVGHAAAKRPKFDASKTGELGKEAKRVVKSLAYEQWSKQLLPADFSAASSPALVGKMDLTLPEAVAFGVVMKTDPSLFKTIMENGFFLDSPPTTAQLEGNAQHAFLAVARTFLSENRANLELKKEHMYGGHAQNVNRHRELLIILGDTSSSTLDVCETFSSQPSAPFNLVVRYWIWKEEKKNFEVDTTREPKSGCNPKFIAPVVVDIGLDVDNAHRFTLFQKVPQAQNA